jgi:hypothetical protein
LQPLDAIDAAGLDGAEFWKCCKINCFPLRRIGQPGWPIRLKAGGNQPVGELPTPRPVSQLAQISWAHFLELIRIDDPWKRAFYENELIQGHWSKRQLQRQIESLLYERTGLSTNKKAVIERARKQEPQESIADVLRDPYILEFTGLVDRPEYSEDELERPCWITCSASC